MGSDRRGRQNPNKKIAISIHAPRVGSDEAEALFSAVFAAISIHAPRVGSDGDCSFSWFQKLYFNPRSPCGERHFIGFNFAKSCEISIHAPRVGSDIKRTENCVNECISIHAPRVGSDRALEYDRPNDGIFQSTLPVWGAT